MSPEVECRCPTCRTAFRAETVCPRCGADLSGLMRVMARAFTLRQRARESLARRDFLSAQTYARQAARLHRTQAGIELLALAESAARTR